MSSAVKIFKHFQTPKASGVYHRLICLTGEKKGTAYFIMDKKRVVLGRGDTADIKVLDLKSSREHAEIIQVGDDFVLTDLGSQNGIVVNDLKIKQHVLSNGDKIIIGKTVYKFSKLEVKAQEEDEEVEEVKTEEEIIEQERDKQLAKFLMGIIVIAIILFAWEESGEEEVIKKEQSSKVELSVYDEDLEKAIRRKNDLSQENQEKIQRYIHRGLREYRENNFFRSYAEFDNAAQWDPKDPRVKFYLRKTKEKQNEIISSYFSKGSRDMDALNFKAAQTAYCTIVRLLLYHFPNDERIQQARDNLRLIEKKTGAPENSIKCTRKDQEE